MGKHILHLACEPTSQVALVAFVAFHGSVQYVPVPLLSGFSLLGDGEKELFSHLGSLSAEPEARSGGSTRRRARRSASEHARRPAFG